MAESKEELKSHLMRVKEEREKAGLKFNIQKTKIMASSFYKFLEITKVIPRIEEGLGGKKV